MHDFKIGLAGGASSILNHIHCYILASAIESPKHSILASTMKHFIDPAAGLERTLLRLVGVFQFQTLGRTHPSICVHGSLAPEYPSYHVSVFFLACWLAYKSISSPYSFISIHSLLFLHFFPFLSFLICCSLLSCCVFLPINFNCVFFSSDWSAKEWMMLFFS